MSTTGWDTSSEPATVTADGQMSSDVSRKDAENARSIVHFLADLV